MQFKVTGNWNTWVIESLNHFCNFIPAGCSSTSQCRLWFPPATSPHNLPSATWESLKACRCTYRHAHMHTHTCAGVNSSCFDLHRYTLEQQIIAPSFSMQQVNCNAVLVPSPVFTSPIMIPHNSFITNQSHSAYHTQPQVSQHSLQLQQPQQFFQVRRPAAARVNNQFSCWDTSATCGQLIWVKDKH